MTQFDSTMLHLALIVAVLCLGLGILGLAVGWVATRFSSAPEENWRIFSGEVRWAAGNSLRLWWDVLRAPIVGFRLALRSDDRRRRAHRRAG